MSHIANIMHGMATAIYKATGYPVYINLKKQNAQFPCFFITHQDMESEQKLNNRYFRQHMFNVLFFMDEKGVLNDVVELDRIAEILYDVLELITVNGELIRGTDMKVKYVDGTIQFLVNYDFFVYRERIKSPKMEVLQQEQEVEE